MRVAHGKQAKNLLQSSIVEEEDVQEIQMQQERQVKADQNRVKIIEQLQHMSQPKKIEYELCENFEIELQPKTFTAD